jgi:spermidine/putrescine-binding protein
LGGFDKQRGVGMYNTRVFPTPPDSWSVVFVKQDLPDGKTNQGRVFAPDVKPCPLRNARVKSAPPGNQRCVNRLNAFTHDHQWGPNLLMYNTRVFPTPPDSWSVVFVKQDLPDGKTNQGRVQAYDGPIYIADAALFVKATQPLHSPLIGFAIRKILLHEDHAPAVRRRREYAGVVLVCQSHPTTARDR